MEKLLRTAYYGRRFVTVTWITDGSCGQNAGPEVLWATRVINFDSHLPVRRPNSVRTGERASHEEAWASLHTGRHAAHFSSTSSPTLRGAHQVIGHLPGSQKLWKEPVSCTMSSCK
ncbi:hypothetical protein ARTHRO8AJ_90087 [Arthrobacter sp. 8AJ]|nr:hypothetical protein ARTHRO8AJ_90087 [Arthrobacter sp. 8AJ]